MPPPTENEDAPIAITIIKIILPVSPILSGSIIFRPTEADELKTYRNELNGLIGVAA